MHALSDNDSGNALYNLTNAKPSDPQQRCIEVSYTGSVPSEVMEPRTPRFPRHRQQLGPEREARLPREALLVFAMRVPASDQPLGAGVRVEVQPPGELDAGADPVPLSAPSLVAGEERRGAVPLRNITVGDVRVQVRVRARGIGSAVRSSSARAVARSAAASC
jgi:hypothetical protein